MNGCNNCKFKDSDLCRNTNASFEVFDPDKGSRSTHYSTRIWHRSDKEHCPDHEAKPPRPTLVQLFRNIFQ